MKFLKNTGVCALLGLSMNALAGGGCPDPSVAWDTVNQSNGGTYSVTATGAAGTSCKLSVSQGPNNNGIATVRDDMPSAETSYRARFYLDATDLMTQSTSGAHRFKAFVVGNGDNPVPTNIDTKARPALLQMFIVGQAGTAARLGGFCRDLNSDGTRARFGDGPNPGTVALQTGWNVIEVEIVTDATNGVCRIWVNNDVEGTPSWETTSMNNALLVGANRANVGSTGSTQAYADLVGAPVTHFDEFESRRQTFMGSL